MLDPSLRMKKKNESTRLGSQACRHDITVDPKGVAKLLGRLNVQKKVWIGFNA